MSHFRRDILWNQLIQVEDRDIDRKELDELIGETCHVGSGTVCSIIYSCFVSHDISD